MVAVKYLILVLMVAAPAFAASPSAAPQDIERSATASVVLGQRLTLRLPNRFGSARQWYVMNDPGPQLQFVSATLAKPETPLPDFPQDQIFAFNTKLAGQKVLRFGY
ncbi:MAG TPA: hypothetical protein DCL48_04600, partial [Alphaproteobacteria bacterium]|nr:hypothetical protein [Alphaproteobacteria bacterium]